MRLKILIPALIILLAALALLFWKNPKPPVANSGQAAEAVAQSNSAASVLKKANTNGSTAIPTRGPSPTQKPAAFDHNNPESIRKYMESQNVPIDFYGQVIDQDSNSIAGANVKGEILHVEVINPAPGGAEDQIVPIDQETDSRGRFEIQGVSGRALQIESIQKDGYEVEPDNCPHSFGTPIGNYENPVLFKMWSTNIHEQLITGEKKFQIVPDGRAYFINLTDGTIAESGEGDLMVWVKYPPQTVRGQLYDWSCEVDVINGGLCPGDSYSMFSAPVSGYVSNFQLQQQIKGGQYGETGEKRFYIQLKNGQEYGRMTIDLYAPYTDQVPGMIRLSYAINPSGSRILR